MANIAILSPGYPTRPGGVTDHTARLVHQWTDWGCTVEVISDIRETGPRAAVDRIHRTGATALLVQYVPFLYGRRGVSRYPENTCRLAAARGIKVTTFVHEPWVPPTRIPWIVLSPIQRWQLLRIIAQSHQIVTAVPAWRNILSVAAQVVYVGCTLGDPPSEPGPEIPSPVIFSPFAAGLNWQWITAAVEAIDSSPPAVVLGASADEARRHHVVGRWFTETWQWRGRLDGPKVLQDLASAKVVLAPYEDGLTGRRTSAMAAGSTGACVISSSGPLFDYALSGGPFATPETVDAFVTEAVRAWHEPVDPVSRAERRKWYRERLDSQLLDRRLLEILTS